MLDPSATRPHHRGIVALPDCSFDCCCFSGAVLDPSAARPHQRGRVALPDCSFDVPEPMNVQEEGDMSKQINRLFYKVLIRIGRTCRIRYCYGYPSAADPDSVGSKNTDPGKQKSDEIPRELPVR